MEFHKILRKLREEKRLTLQELAKKLNMSVPTLSNYENNRRMPHIEILRILANFFNVSLEYLTTGKEMIEELPNGIKRAKTPKYEETSELSIKDIVKETIKEVANQPQTLEEHLTDLKALLDSPEVTDVMRMEVIKKATETFGKGKV